MKKLFTAIVLFLVLLPPAWGADGDPFLQGKSETEEGVEDIVGGMVTGNTETGITVTYQDDDGTIDFEVTSASDTTAGISELATAAEAAAGTSTSLVLTPDAYNDSRMKVFNVLAYGADGADAWDDGSGEDTSDIQEAIDAAEAAGGGIVYIPSGTYYVDDGGTFCMNITRGITIKGDGRDSTFILSRSTDKPIFLVDIDDGTTLDREGFSFFDLHIGSDVDGGITAVSGQSGIKIQSTNTDGSSTYESQLHTIERCNFEDNYIATYFYECRLWVVQNCFFETNTYGIYIDNHVSTDSDDRGSSRIAFNTISGGTPIYQVASGGTQIISNKITHASGIGYHGNFGADWATDVSTSNLHFIGNSFENGANYDIKITTEGTSDNIQNIMITGNEFAQLAGGSSRPAGIYIGAADGGTDITAVTITGNVFNDAGIELGEVSGVLIANNFIDDITGGGAGDVAIKISDTAVNVQIYGNDFSEVVGANVISGSVDSALRVDGGDNAADSSEIRLYLDGVLNARFFAYGDGDQVIDHEGTLKFRHYNTGTPVTTMQLQPDGDLIVTGDVTATGGDFIGTNCCADYVFEPDYPLMSLDEMSAHIKQNNSLPNITQADQVRLGKMSQLLLEKTEEQALYILQLHEQNKRLNERLEKLEAKLQ